MRMDNLETQFRSFKAELKTDILQELRRDSPTPTVNNSMQSVNEQVLACLREEKEREKRRLNLCLRNVPEADSSANDRAQVFDLFRSNLGVNPTELNSGIANMKRIGDQSDDRPRIIIIECSNADFKMNLLRNAFKFKNYSLPNNKKVFLAPDMTKKQLEDDRKLRDELTARRSNGEDLIIRRGKIIVRPTRSGTQIPRNSNPTQGNSGSPIG